MTLRAAYAIAALICASLPAAATEIDRVLGCRAGDDLDFRIVFVTRDDGTGGTAILAGGEVAAAAITQQASGSMLIRVRPKPGMPQITLITLKPSLAALVSTRQGDVNATRGARCEDLPLPEGDE